MNENKATIAVLGGTGKEGSGLARRWAHRGHKVIIGSRSADRAREAAKQMSAALGVAVTGMELNDAAAAAEIIVLAVPYAGQQETALAVKDQLRGKILIDVTVPLMPPQVSRVQLPDGRSAVEKLQELLGEDVRVVSAFQNISAHHLDALDSEIDCDVLVCGDDKSASEMVVALAQEIGLRAWYAGPLCNSVVSEGLTSVLIALNRRYKVPASGIRITGLDRPAA
jgi:8-hydroxy-5-deazaflavin:NADPH oxidoreductase